MSRICIKSLGREHDEKILRKHFSQLGATVTDAKVVRHPDGVSRCFGFVGFKTEQEAKKAVKHFNNTFLDTKRIVVEIAKPFGDESIARPWSKYSEGSSAFAREHETEATSKNDKKKKSAEDKFASNPDASKILKEASILKEIRSGKNSELQEFVTAAKGRKAVKIWANDPMLSKAKTSITTVKNRKPGGEGLSLTKIHMKFGSDDEDEGEMATGEGSESDDEYQDLSGEKKKDDSDGSDGEDSMKKRQENTTAFNDNLQDLDYLKSKKVAKFSDDEDSEAEGEPAEKKKEETEKNKGKGKGKEKVQLLEDSSEDDADVEMKDAEEERKNEIDDIFSKKNEKGGDAAMSGKGGEGEGEGEKEEEERDEVGETGRLFLRNLSYLTDESDLRKLFSTYGDLSDVHLCVDRETKKPTGMAFILFLMPECAVKAMAALDGKIFQGRLLHILPAKSSAGDTTRKMKIKAGSSYKLRKEEERQGKAMDSSNWNSLFMRSDAVADAVAENIGVDKYSLLDPEAESSMAVRLALGETHIISDTKAFLEKEGINLTAFEGAKGRAKGGGRSNNVLIVKNIPHTTEETNLRQIFGKFGDLGRVLVPPARTMAIVEFVASDDARRAFRVLAYTMFKGVPLYLEWAPEGAFNGKPVPRARVEEPTPPANPDEKSGAKSDPKIETKSEKPTVEKKPEIPAAEPANFTGTTIFVKNLNFETTEEALKAHCLGSGKVKSAVIMKRKDKKRGLLSLGYGFVEYISTAEAERAVRRLNGTKLDGHELECKLSTRKSDAANDDSAAPQGEEIKARGTKITVRNVAFEATRNELRELFGAFGQINSVRIPKKFDGKHRGFAFIDFITKEEAASAFKALQNTHFYGRHLVLEWAHDDLSLEAVREKTAKLYSQLQDSTSANIRKRRVETDLKEMVEEGGGDSSGDDDDEIQIFNSKKKSRN